jgi:C1A family cysteine protease
MTTSKEKVKTRKRSYGWRPDLPDHRDLLYAAVMRAPAPLPAKVDLRTLCPAVEDQGQLGSCTANALVGALEFLELKGKSTTFADLSRLFVYYNERAIEGTVKSDSGAMLRDGIKALAKQGVCRETAWPYVVTRFTKKPGVGCYKEAAAHTISSYHRLNTVEEMRACLADGYPFVFGFTVYDSFESATVATSGILNLPKAKERPLGGHAVMAVGYDDNVKRFIVRNSWGPDWGKQGYFTIPYVYLADRNLSDDFWTVRK